MVISLEIICPCITRPMFMKVLSQCNPPMLFEVINCFSMIDGHVHHIMKVLEDSTLHFHIFDFFSTMKSPCFENMPTTKVGNLVHTPYDLNKDTCNKTYMSGWG